MQQLFQPFSFPCGAPLHLRMLLVVVGLVLAKAVSAQILDRRPSAQQRPQRDTSLEAAEDLAALPDTIKIHRYDPRFPVRYRLLPDSSLSLDYIRVDPVEAYGPDHVYLNSIGLPAALNPLLTTPYQRYRPLRQVEHPAYRDQPLPFFSQNIPFSYTAYNQGGEIDDGQVTAIFGRSFSDGWRLGASYYRTYQGGERNRYPESRAQRIQFGITLAHVPDSSHHRSYAYIDLNNRSWNNSGGYDFALIDSIGPIEQAFTASPQLTGVRTEGRNSTYSYLHRYFLQQQRDSLAKGWAASGQATYRQGRHLTSVTQPLLYEAEFAPYLVDNRGLRFAISERSLLGEAAVEYFTNAAQKAGYSFNLQLGAYAGSQQFRADYLSTEPSLLLLGLKGKLAGTVFGSFSLQAEADIPFGERAGEGLLSGVLGWNYRTAFRLEAIATIERSAAPWSAGAIGVNNRLIYETDLPVGTHTKLGASATLLGIGAQVGASLDVYTNATVYGRFGEAREAANETAIPSLSFNLPLNFGALRMEHRGVLRSQIQTQSVKLPAYAGQHSLYGNFWLFERAMNLIVGIDGIVRSPTGRYGYFPLTSVFTTDAPSELAPWTYALDGFVAFKVQSFKAFVKLDNVLVSSRQPLPATVEGYPIVQGSSIFGARPLLRFGVAFFLFN